MMPSLRNRFSQRFSTQSSTSTPKESTASRKAMAEDRRQFGIRILLATEHEAQQIVNAAKAAKVAKLNQAREEAEKEAAGYRALMEVESQKNVGESTGDYGANMERIEQEKQKKDQSLEIGG